MKNTTLLIRQNSSDNLQSFKSDILNQVNKKDNALCEKDKSIALLEQKLIENSFDNKQLRLEINVFSPKINSVSVSNQNLVSHDSTSVSTVLICNSNSKLTKVDKEKLRTWMLKKLGIDNIEITETEK